jgi:electron transport complex protein RnfA
MSALGALGVISGLSLNLVLQFGLGIRRVALQQEEKEDVSPFSPLPWGILFLSVPLLWVFFAYIAAPLFLGSFEYLLLFPLCVLVSGGLEKAAGRFFPQFVISPSLFNPWTAYNGLLPAALMVTIALAVSLMDAVVLSLGLSLGIFAAFLLLREIRRRASLEPVPRLLRGAPLMLISLGLLSLIFSSLGFIFMHILGYY